jgi:hypothetical protein
MFEGTAVKSSAEAQFKLSPTKNNILLPNRLPSGGKGMKASIAFFVILLLISPSPATVLVTCNDLGNWAAELNYEVLDEPNLVRVFGLDITVDAGATIKSITDYIIGESTAANPGYGMFFNHPDTPVAPGDAPAALGGLGTDGITIEMGALWLPPGDDSPNAPLPKGTLLAFTIDPHGAERVNVSIAENVLRGGIVLTDPLIDPNVRLVGCTIIPEPATGVLSGLGGLALLRKRRT